MKIIKYYCDVCGKEVDSDLSLEGIAIVLMGQSYPDGFISRRVKDLNKIENACADCRNNFSEKAEKFIKELSLGKQGDIP